MAPANFLPIDPGYRPFVHIMVACVEVGRAADGAAAAKGSS